MCKITAQNSVAYSNGTHRYRCPFPVRPVSVDHNHYEEIRCDEIILTNGSGFLPRTLVNFCGERNSLSRPREVAVMLNHTPSKQVCVISYLHRLAGDSITDRIGFERFQSVPLFALAHIPQN